MRRVPMAALAAALLAAACADPDAELAVAAQTALVGRTKAELLSCAGVPHRSATAGAKEFLTYSAAGLDSIPRSEPVLVEREDRRGRLVLDREWITAYDVVETSCEATVTLADGVVEQLVYGGGRDPRRCASLVAACMAPAR